MIMINYIKEQIKASIDTKQNILNDTKLMETIAEVAKECVVLYKNGKKTLLAGNGGSAADAQHFAGELVGRFVRERRALSAVALSTDTSVLTSVANDHVQLINPDDLRDLDYSIFWHCNPNAQAGFVVLDKGQVLALATVCDQGDPFWEIGMDVTPNARRNGLGKAVVETAARWILEQGKQIVASAAPFNSPSLRTLRSVGLNYVFTTMRSSEMPMKVFPQQLGVPLPNTPLYNYYPDWAMNQSILPKKN